MRDLDYVRAAMAPPSGGTKPLTGEVWSFSRTDRSGTVRVEDGTLIELPRTTSASSRSRSSRATGDHRNVLDGLCRTGLAHRLKTDTGEFVFASRAAMHFFATTGQAL